MFNNNKIEVTSYGLFSSKVTHELVIVHLSDLHEKEFGHKNSLLFHKVHSLKPDIIAITGDLVAHENQKGPDILYTEQLAHGLSSIAPSYFVTGNHEKQFDSEITGALAQNGVPTIRKGIYSHHIRGSKVNISGMDDVDYETADLKKAVTVFKEEPGYNIFLAHRPEFFSEYLNKNIDLVLCGHTHAGQIRFPKFGALAVRGQGFFPKYVQGEFTDGETTMIISRGLGSSGYPAIRINNPPDLVVVYVSPLQR